MSSTVGGRTCRGTLALRPQRVLRRWQRSPPTGSHRHRVLLRVRVRIARTLRPLLGGAHCTSYSCEGGLWVPGCRCSVGIALLPSRTGCPPSAVRPARLDPLRSTGIFAAPRSCGRSRCIRDAPLRGTWRRFVPTSTRGSCRIRDVAWGWGNRMSCTRSQCSVADLRSSDKVQIRVGTRFRPCGTAG